jgi:hypothetical protein
MLQQDKSDLMTPKTATKPRAKAKPKKAVVKMKVSHAVAKPQLNEHGFNVIAKILAQEFVK